MSREREETRDEYLDREEQHEIEQQARFALDMANRLAAPGVRVAARLQLVCAALAGSPVAAGSPDTVGDHAIRVADYCLAKLYPEDDHV